MNEYSIVLNVIMIALCLVLGLLSARRIKKRIPHVTFGTVQRRAPWLNALLPAWTAIAVFLLYASYSIDPYTVWLPEWITLWSIVLSWLLLIGLFAFAFALTAELVRLSSDSRWKSLAVAGVLFLACLQIVQWQYHRPVAHSLKVDLTPEGVVLQTSGVSCAAATGANIARSLGVDMTEPRMAELMGTGPFGTSIGQFMRGMRKVDIECETVFLKSRELGAIEPPADLTVDHDGEPHSVAYMGMVNGMAEVLDPLAGRVLYPPSELVRIWSGGAMQCRKIANPQ